MLDRTAHLEECHQRLEEWRELVRKLEARAASMPEDERRQREQTIASLVHYIEEGEECAKRTGDMDDSTWSASKADAQDAWKRLEDNFNEHADSLMYGESRSDSAR